MLNSVEYGCRNAKMMMEMRKWVCGDGEDQIEKGDVMIV